MTRKHFALLAGVLLLVALAPAEDQGKAAVTWRAQDIQLDAPVRAGEVLLPAGEYRVRHILEGDKHFLLFRQFAGERKEFKVACTMEPLPEKARQSEQHFRDLPGGEIALLSLVFRGDTVRHLF